MTGKLTKSGGGGTGRMGAINEPQGMEEVAAEGGDEAQDSAPLSAHIEHIEWQ